MEVQQPQVDTIASTVGAELEMTREQMIQMIIQMKRELAEVKRQQLIHKGEIRDTQNAVAESERLLAEIPKRMKSKYHYKREKIRNDGNCFKLVARASKTMNHGFTYLDVELQIDASSCFLQKIDDKFFEFIEGVHDCVALIYGDETEKIWRVKCCIKNNMKYHAEICFYDENGNIATPVDFMSGPAFITMLHTRDEENFQRPLVPDLKGKALLDKLMEDGEGLGTEYGAWNVGMETEYDIIFQARGYANHPYFNQQVDGSDSSPTAE